MSLCWPSIAQIPECARVSIDTYRPEVVERFGSELERQRPDLILVWNDVSGVWDDAMEDFLQRFPRAEVVVGATGPVSCREEVQEHWRREDYFSPADVVEKVSNHVQFIRNKNKNSAQRVWHDPLFGFAKDHATNLALWQALPQIYRADERVVIGISRKRFVRAQLALEDQQNVKLADELQVKMFQHLLERWPVLERPLLALRVHDSNCLLELARRLKIKS